jgi:hypothetical protein
MEEETGSLNRCLYLWKIIFNRLLLTDEFDGTVIEANPSVPEVAKHDMAADPIVRETQKCKTSESGNKHYLHRESHQD